MSSRTRGEIKIFEDNFSEDDLFRDGSKPNLQPSNTNSSIEGPMDCLAWLMTHSFGISLVYPGSMALMKMMLEKPLMDGRTKLVVDHLGERSKVVTWDRNEIDTMFVDMRKKY